jgi:hypothetical protein
MIGCKNKAQYAENMKKYTIEYEHKERMADNFVKFGREVEIDLNR